jgi:hypothetical protein
MSGLKLGSSILKEVVIQVMPCIGLSSKGENCKDEQEIKDFLSDNEVRFIPIFTQNWLELEEYLKPVQTTDYSP